MVDKEWKSQELTISRTQGNLHDEINIRLIDGVKVIDVRVSPADFTKAIFGDFFIPCKVRK